ncbi:protein of unknown function [Taphrina deformans PYCC 5710]|uniref:Uncharacterized protein n=1 Tax=Taphrina deformans (strain PYCC 5710 / ATCC 11124 / CBS 356.35 / IMI 108563 / JCM 9778 / NBRC 8474) TaxID=1097556 RepID=R4XII5_TAPDE|nr:protein of unknown function [Taphrina deformans PYCC 5710]|eukprot:CCG84314.1 protein of unknown function [Taphrina deformans PYCC 5710]
MQSVLYTRLFQCDPQATSSREESLAASLNPKAYSMFGIEFAATELLMYRPCAALPKRNTQDLLRLAEAAVRSVQAAFGTVISQPKKFYAYFMISRVYTSALSLIYAFSQTEIVHDSSNEVFRSQLAPTLSKACACLFHLTQEYLVGQNLALRFVQIHARFFEWLNAGATEELGLLEIRDFHMHHLGLLDRNHGEEGNAWTKLMHRLLTEPSVPAATMEATASGSHVGGVTGAVVLESVNGEKQGTVDSNQYAAPYQTSMIPDTNSYHEQIQHSDGLAQPAPYSQMSQFGVPGQQSQAYKFADQSLSHNNNAHFNQAGQPDGQTYTQHLPHQPRLQAGHETSNLTPLQQLAATAASHPTRTSHDHPRTASGGYTG